MEKKPKHEWLAVALLIAALADNAFAGLNTKALDMHDAAVQAIVEPGPEPH